MKIEVEVETVTCGVAIQATPGDRLMVLHGMVIGRVEPMLALPAPDVDIGTVQAVMQGKATMTADLTTVPANGIAPWNAQNRAPHKPEILKAVARMKDGGNAFHVCNYMEVKDPELRRQVSFNLGELAKHGQLERSGGRVGFYRVRK